MRNSPLLVSALLLTIGLVVVSAIRCDAEDYWTVGSPALEAWDPLNAEQVEIIQFFVDWSRQFTGGELRYNADACKVQFYTTSYQPAPKQLRRVLPGAETVSIKLDIRQFRGEVAASKPTAETVNGHPTALSLLSSETVLWERNGLTVWVTARARDANNRSILTPQECAFAVARALDQALGAVIDRSVSGIILLDTSAAMADDLEKAIAVVKSKAVFLSVNVTAQFGPTAIEWAFLTCAGKDVYVRHGFTQDMRRTVAACSGLKAEGERDLAWGVAYALAYLHANARAPKGGIVIISNGADARQRRSIAKLNKMLSMLKLGSGKPRANPPPANTIAPLADVAPTGTAGQPDTPQRLGVAGETLDQALARAEGDAQANSIAFGLDCLGFGVAAGSEAEGLLQSIAQAAGGQYLPGRTPEQLQAFVERPMEPAPSQPVAPTPPAAEQPPPPVAPEPIGADDADVIISLRDGAQAIEMGRLTAYNGVYYTLMTEHGMPARVMGAEVVSLLIGGIGEGVPVGATERSIALRNGTIIAGEVTEFADGVFTVKKPDGTTMKLSREQVRAVVVR